MYICKDCGNYYKFTGSSTASITNKLTPTARDKYEEETALEYEGVDFVSCNECGSGSVVDVEVSTIPKHLQDQIYNTASMGVVEGDIMQELKAFVNK